MEADRGQADATAALSVGVYTSRSTGDPPPSPPFSPMGHDPDTHRRWRLPAAPLLATLLGRFRKRQYSERDLLQSEGSCGLGRSEGVGAVIGPGGVSLPPSLSLSRFV